MTITLKNPSLKQFKRAMSRPHRRHLDPRGELLHRWQPYRPAPGRSLPVLGAAWGTVRDNVVLLAFGSPSNPPEGITGGGLTSHGRSGVKIDYLNVTIPIAQLDDVCEIISNLFGEYGEDDFGFHSYHKLRKWVGGAIVTFTPERAEFLASFSGDPLELLPHMEVLKLIQTFAEMGGRFSRIDVCYDDYERSVPLEKVHAAGNAYNYTGFKKYNPHRPLNRGVLEGDQAEFGVRGENSSGKYYRIYDKELESDGEIDCIRWEAEFSKKVADEVVRRFLLGVTSQGELAAALGSILVAFIDFVERGGETHLDRMAPLDWWKEFRARLSKFEICISILQPTPPLQKWGEYAKVNVLPTMVVLRTVVESQGYDFFDLLEVMMEGSADRVDWKKQGSRKLGIDVDQLLKPVN